MHRIVCPKCKSEDIDWYIKEAECFSCKWNGLTKELIEIFEEKESKKETSNVPIVQVQPLRDLDITYRDRDHIDCL